MRTLAIGDIHGCYKALKQCLERSKFDKEKDELISLGDVADGWSYVVESVDELLTIKNLIPVKGNHDEWAEHFLKYGVPDVYHLDNGGQSTVDSYNKAGTDKMIQHLREFYSKQIPYYIDDQNRLFVHGGVDWKKPISEQSDRDIMWNRHMYTTAIYWELFAITHPTARKDYFKRYKEVFIGHTATNYKIDYRFDATTKPVNVVNLWNLDQGAGWSGKLTIMDVNTKEYWQSDTVTDLYPEETNARKP
jgi:serine/threonine protein phosphatase 1